MIISIVYKEKKLSAGAMLQALIKGVGLTLLVKVRGIVQKLSKNAHL